MVECLFVAPVPANVFPAHRQEPPATQAQRRLLVILSIILLGLVLVVAFGPEPTHHEPTLEELAAWTVPQDDEWREVGDPTVQWYDLEIDVPLDPNDPCGEMVEVTIPQACWMPTEPQAPVYY